MKAENLLSSFFKSIQQPDRGLKSNSVAVYFTLLYLKSNSKQKNAFYVSYLEVLNLTGLASPKSYYTSLRELCDKGYIILKPGLNQYAPSKIQITPIRSSKK